MNMGGMWTWIMGHGVLGGGGKDMEFWTSLERREVQNQKCLQCYCVLCSYVFMYSTHSV